MSTLEVSVFWSLSVKAAGVRSMRFDLKLSAEGGRLVTKTSESPVNAVVKGTVISTRLSAALEGDWAR